MHRYSLKAALKLRLQEDDELFKAGPLLQRDLATFTRADHEQIRREDLQVNTRVWHPRIGWGLISNLRGILPKTHLAEKNIRLSISIFDRDVVAEHFLDGSRLHDEELLEEFSRLFSFLQPYVGLECGTSYLSHSAKAVFYRKISDAFPAMIDYLAVTGDWGIRARIGHNCRGHNYRGHNYRGHNYRGHHYRGHNYRGHNYRGHDYLGHNYLGHSYLGHNYLGHNYIGIDAREKLVQGLNVLFEFETVYAARKKRARKDHGQSTQLHQVIRLRDRPSVLHWLAQADSDQVELFHNCLNRLVGESHLNGDQSDESRDQLRQRFQRASSQQRVMAPSLKGATKAIIAIGKFKAAAAARQARADDATAQPPPRMATVAETLADETIASVQETAAGQTAADVSVDCGPPPQLLRDATVDSVVSVVGSTGARMCCACTCVACSYGNACIFGRRAGISDIEDLDELEMSVQNSAEPAVTMV